MEWRKFANNITGLDCFTASGNFLQQTAIENSQLKLSRELVDFLLQRPPPSKWSVGCSPEMQQAIVITSGSEISKHKEIPAHTCQMATVKRQEKKTKKAAKCW